MKSVVITLLILCNGLLNSQDQGVQIPDGIGGFLIYDKPDSEVIDHQNKIVEYKLDELTINSKWWYHLTVSSCRLYLGQDSSLYHFQEAYKIYPKTTCSQMSVRHNTFIKALEKERMTGIEDGFIKAIKEETGDSIFSWYLWDLPDFDEFAFVDSCNLKYPGKQVKKIVKDSMSNSEILRRRDQRYRSIGKLQEQQKLDQINRSFVDSLYDLKETLRAFDEDEIYQISMVIHHSDDCDWNYMWMERLINYYMTGYKGKMLLGPLLERMLSAKDGYCTKQDVQKRDYFIYMIKDRHPEFSDKSKIGW